MMHMRAEPRADGAHVSNLDARTPMPTPTPRYARPSA